MLSAEKLSDSYDIEHRI